MKVKLELLSDALPGSSQMIGGLIDMDVCVDEYGVPYIPARRIKGILKNSALRLKDANIINGDIDEIFLKPFRLSNGYLHNHNLLINFFKSINSRSDSQELAEIFNKSTIIDYFTYLRSQTAVDYKKGVSQEHSLRIFRVLKKGLTFYFDIEIDQSYRSEMKKICQVTREFGSMRNRGLGKIKMELIEPEDQLMTNLSEDTNNNHQKNYKDILENLNKVNDDEITSIYFELKNEEQILVSNNPGDHTTTNYFIPGSTIQGTLASKFIERKRSESDEFDPNLAHENEEFRRLFLNNQVKFTNFYPKIKQNVYFPPPLALIKHKNYGRYYDKTRKDLEKLYEDIQSEEYKLLNEFVSLKDNSAELIIYTPDIQKNVEYHHKRPEDRSIGHATREKGQFFQYEVLRPHQTFMGCIIGPKAELQTILKFIPPNGLKMRIGKSRSAQYGNCLLSPAKPGKKEQDKEKSGGSNELIITLVSDMILINNFGHVVPDVRYFINELAQRLEIEPKDIVITEKYLKFCEVGGFNSVWTLPKPQYHALAAGSELKIELKDGIDIDISYLENTFYGLRRSEGYGQIKVNWHHHDKVQKARLPKVRIDLPHNLVKIADFIEFCLFQNLKYKLKEKGHEQASEFYRRRSDLPSSSFFYRIKAIIENTNDFKELGELFNNIFHKEKYLADGKEHKVSKQFREKLNTIITGLKYSKGEPGPEGNYLTNFKEFVSMLNNLNVIESNTFLRNTLIPKLSDKVSVTYYKEENERLFMLYTLYCKIFLKDVLNKLK